MRWAIESFLRPWLNRKCFSIDVLILVWNDRSMKNKIFLGALIFVSLASDAQTMDAGLWQADSVVNIEGIPLPSSQDKECITKSQAKDIRKTISTELGKQGCKINKWSLRAEKLQASVTCDNHDIEASGDLTGTVKAKSYNISGTAAGNYKSIPATANISLKGKWLSACK